MGTLVEMRMAKTDIENILDEVLSTSDQFQGLLIEERDLSANYAVNDTREAHRYWMATCWFQSDGPLTVIVNDESGAVSIIDRLGTQPWNSQNWNFRW
jgi:hypothetical protein